MSTTKKENSAGKREAWGRLRKLPSGRWQVRYPGPDGNTYTARTDDDKPLTFFTKTDARTWLASVHTQIARGEWEPPEARAARLRAEAEAEQARSIGFAEYANRWIELIRTQPNRSGKKRALGTVRSYKSKVDGYLIPEFGDTPVRAIDEARIRVMTNRLDTIPSPLNPKSKFNGVTRPVLVVLMMILRQAARDGIIPAAPNISVPKQEPVRHDADRDELDDLATPEQVEALHEAVPQPWAIMVLLAAWCQLRRGECLGLQRRDIALWPPRATTATVATTMIPSTISGHAHACPAPMPDRAAKSASAVKLSQNAPAAMKTVPDAAVSTAQRRSTCPITPAPVPGSRSSPARREGSRPRFPLLVMTRRDGGARCGRPSARW